MVVPTLRRAIVFLAVVGAVLTACSSGAGPAHPPPGPATGRLLDRALPAAVRHVRLIDSSGRAVTLAALAGKVVVVSDMLTLCQGTCPLDTADLVAAARRVTAAGAGRRVAFLSITLDPRRDVARRLAAYRRRYRPAPSDWYVLTGRPKDLDLLWDTLGVFRRVVPERGRDVTTGARLTYDLTHSDEVFFLDRGGRERFRLQGGPHIAPGSAVPARLRSVPRSWSSQDALRVLSWLLDTSL